MGTAMKNLMFELERFGDRVVHFVHQSRGARNLWYNVSSVALMEGADVSLINIPGTSWVVGSFSTPMLHFVGCPLCSSNSSLTAWFPVVFRLKTDVHPLFVVRPPSAGIGDSDTMTVGVTQPYARICRSVFRKGIGTEN